MTSVTIMTNRQIKDIKNLLLAGYFIFLILIIKKMVPVSGLEPLLPKKPDFESSVSTNSTTLALSFLKFD